MVSVNHSNYFYLKIDWTVALLMITTTKSVLRYYCIVHVLLWPLDHPTLVDYFTNWRKDPLKTWQPLILQVNLGSWRNCLYHPHSWLLECKEVVSSFREDQPSRIHRTICDPWCHLRLREVRNRRKIGVWFLPPFKFPYLLVRSATRRCLTKDLASLGKFLGNLIFPLRMFW